MMTRNVRDVLSHHALRNFLFHRCDVHLTSRVDESGVAHIDYGVLATVNVRRYVPLDYRVIWAFISCEDADVVGSSTNNFLFTFSSDEVMNHSLCLNLHRF